MNWSKIFFILGLTPWILYGMDIEEQLWEEFSSAESVQFDEFTRQMMLQEKDNAPKDIEENQFIQLEQQVRQQLGLDSTYDLKNNVFFEKMCNKEDLQHLFMEAVQATKAMHNAWRILLQEAGKVALPLLAQSDDRSMDAQLKKCKSMHPENKTDQEALKAFKLAMYFTMYFQRKAVKEICPWLQDSFNPHVNYNKEYIVDTDEKGKKRCKTTG